APQRCPAPQSCYDVSKAEGAFAVSKAILGFANRMPDVAAQWAEGHAYLMVGVEERMLHGVPTHDIEKVDAWLGRYLGDFGRYQLTYVPVDNGEGTKQVMLVDVSPPRWGDPLHTLHKEYQHFRPGTVFHRYTGRTEPCSPGRDRGTHRTGTARDHPRESRRDPHRRHGRVGERCTHEYRWIACSPVR
ncbi:hypothetical protein ACWGCP_25415, partial [Streptomyces niveus]